MKNTETFLTICIVATLLFSCTNKSGKTNNPDKRSSEQTLSDTSANKKKSDFNAITEVQEKVKDIDGNEYNTIRIGTQTWMVKNLKTTRYNDGTPIPLVTDSTAWAALSSSGYCWYNNEMSSYKPSYGALYNGYVVNTGKLCPKGWHVPGDGDWTILTTYLGGESVAGGKLKESGTSYWVSPNTGADNESGFTALPGGLRYHDGIFHDFGFSGYWWTSTSYSEERAFFRYMDYEYSNVFRFDNVKKIGFSVRCVRDF